MKRKTYVSIVIILIILSASALVANRYLPGFLHKTLREKVASLRKKGIVLKYDSLQLNLWQRQIEIDTIILDIPEKKISAEVYNCKINSFHILPLLFRKRIHLNDVTADEVKFSMIKKNVEKEKLDADQKGDLSIIINSINIRHAFFRTEDSTSRDTVTIQGNIQVKGLSINYTRDESPWTFHALSMDSLTFDFPFYTIVSDHLELDKDRRHLAIDTLRIKPRFSKREHARRKRVEDDRFHGIITAITADGFDFETGDSAFVNASALKFSFAMDIYRNKHYPFPRRDYMPLPMDALKRLPFALTLDTVRIRDSYVSYEELGEEADSTGTLYFDKLEAGIFHISTDTTMPAPYLEASSALMGKGKLKMTCQFSNTKKPAMVKGSLSNFPLTLVNDILRPQAKVEVESGTMMKLNFSFGFGEYRSDGAVDLSYKDLKITSLRKDKDKDKAVRNNLLTLAINTFIKDDAGQFVTGEKQTGIILFYRDRKKAIFNYWWKSLFSGIKSSVALRTEQTDRLTAEKNAKKDRKKRMKKKE